jgi:putative phage-type endonuclease
MVNRQAFLEDRRKGIGSSDVAKVLGLSRFGTALDVYLSKVRPADATEMTTHQEWGVRAEPMIAAAICDHHGWTLNKIPTVIHREHRFLRASPDRLNQSGEAVEIKTTARADGWGEPETDEVPEDYWLQAQHQLEVLHETYGTEVCWVFVLVGGSDFRRYRVPRDPGYLDTVFDPLREFWRCVEEETPPPPDWSHRSTLDALQKLHTPIKGRAVSLDDEAQRLADRYSALGDEISGLKDQRDEVKARLVAALEDAETGMLPDGRLVARKEVHRKEYTVQATSYFDLRIRKGWAS